MSSADLWEDDYPHGTVEGHDGGCRGGACPAAAVGMSCKRAKMLAAGDVRYNRLAAAGKTPAEIAAIIDGHVDEQAKPVSTPKPKSPRAKRSAAEPASAVLVDERNEAESPIDPSVDAELSPAVPEIEAPVTDPEPPASEAAPVVHADAEPQPADETPAASINPEPPAPTEETTVPLETTAPLTTEKYTAGLNPAGRAFVLRGIRDWARTHGFPGIPNRGRIPQAALAAFSAAHPDGLVPDAPTPKASSGIDAHVAQLREVRIWARANGWPDLGDRGIVDDEIREAYNAAHAAPVALVNQEHPVVHESLPAPHADDVVRQVTTGVISSDDWDAVRERVGLPPRVDDATAFASEDRPEPGPIWGDVTVSEDVERARNLAVLLEGQNALALEQLGAAHTITQSCIAHNRDLREQLDVARRDAFQQETVLRIAESSNRLLQSRIDELDVQVADLEERLAEATKPWWKRIL